MSLDSMVLTPMTLVSALTVLAVQCVLRLPETRAEQGLATATREAHRQQDVEPNQVDAQEYFWVV